MQKSDRMLWVDAARALSVIAVVLMHTTIWAVIPADRDAAAALFWNGLNNAIVPLRMPALLMVSGFLLSSRVRAGWRDGRTRVSVATSYYLYMLWLALYAVLGAFGLWVGVGGSFAAFVGQLLLPQTILWYLLALAWWAGVLALLHKVPALPVAVGLALLAVAAPFLPGEPGVDLYRSVLAAGVYFGVGVYARPWLSHAGDVVLIAVGGAGLAAYVALQLLVPQVPGTVAESTLVVLRGVLAGPVVFAIAVIAVKWVLLGRLLGSLGRNTLPIYVLHAPLVIALAHADWWWHLVEGTTIRWLSAPVAAMVIVGACVVIGKTAERIGLGFLFGLPAPLRRRLELFRRPEPGVAA